MADLGKLLLFFGIFLVIAGGVLSLGWKVPWLGRLPGDIRIEGEHFRFYFPIVTCLLVSFILTLILKLFRR